MSTAGTRAARSSPNHGDRRDGLRPDLVVLHFTAMATAELALDRLCDPEAEVSAHWLIARDGEVHSLVPEDRRAWHAGAGSWRGQGDINSRSIGIELDNDGRSPFSEPLMSALEDLLPGVMARHGIGPAGVIGHSDMAPGRKVDPGGRFDWLRIVRRDLALWPHVDILSIREEGPGDTDELERRLTEIGYPGEASREDRLAAFRLRARPFFAGPADATDIARARAVVARLAEA
ncbi:N-acetylmuramoyl-L-alanine amidase [Roseicyclus sp. F158]|uniref:N-acetylmuramoyl-L-alanine amidase n=1 Tax=Tropicimonas omnivorans TaxID=3075590 RepID=A0ABU3DGH7_9RHOB|nr:N-acetylmuramoyl-L-alanine amidase [Roseicyclus sp. F158]MDT0682787.1 N-acetylmuramoyl-L-alanine amidase [Roseicyclus sp. F158]